MWGKVLILVGIVIGVTACGSGNEPVGNLGDPSKIPVGTMDLPLASQFNSLIQLVTPFSSSSPYFTISSSNGFTGFTVVPIRAPATGMVSAAVVGQSITIMVTPRVSVQVSNVNTSVQVGNYVTQDQQIGTAANLTGQMQFSVYVDGTAVCPLSFLNGTARSSLISFYSNNNICGQ